jgi:glucose/arabinose dehydrogenase
LPPLLDVAYEEVASIEGMPVLVAAPPDDPRLFIVAKSGIVSVMPPGSSVPETFLDISGLVRDEGERGLLGLAFDPDYSSTGTFFVHYSDRSGTTVVASYRVSGDVNRADPDSGRVLFTASQPASNHNGGMLEFGPDGRLYLALGDGGGANDRYGNGQRPDTVLGTILRFEVAGDELRPAPGNPFADGVDGAPEVWAYGLRNPWRFAFDGELLYIGDVGQNAYEEINVVPASQPAINFGWPVTEGLHCFAPASGCVTDGLTLPAVEYEHGDRGACSVTGGRVYRGSAIPELAGHYFYSDYCGGWLRSFRWDGSEVQDHRDWTDQVGVPGQIVSFGADAAGELYVTTAAGSVLKLVPVR